jgi:hypothetical protein
MALISDPDNLTDGSVDNGSTEVYINTSTKTIKLNTTGNLSTDGVTLKALYSFLKEEWRNDPNSKNLAAFPFPMTPITDESFELIDGWDFFNDAARYLIRTGGWTVRNTSGNVTQRWAGIIGLGSIESNDQLYFQQVSAGAASNVQLTGQINQAVQIFRDDDGDGITAEASDFDRRTFFKVFVREQAQTYDDANLTDIGVTTMEAQAYRFPIATGGDTLKITNSDNAISSSTPYSEILVRYMSQSFTRDVDLVGTGRNFGIVIDVGTHSGVDGVTTAGGTTLTSAAGQISGSFYTTGTLYVHEGSNKGTYNILGTPSATVVTITGATFAAANSGQSFTLQRSVPVSATAEQIYEKIQWYLRQNADIDSMSTTVTGKTADLLLDFVGDTLNCGRFAPSNPNGGGSGVIVEGFASADTNRITFYDNTATARTYPFVAVLTLQFGANLTADSNARYWVYFTTLPGGSNDFGESGATVVEDNSSLAMSGSISGQSSIQRTFNYDGNVQGGRTAATDAAITVVAIGLSTGQYVRTTGNIARSTANTVSLVAALERNYANP